LTQQGCNNSAKTTHDEDRFTFEIASTTEKLREVAQKLENFMSPWVYNVKTKSEIILAVSEAVANAIIHGNQRLPGKSVRITFRRRPSEMVVTVKDQGQGFDPKQLPDPLTSNNRMKTSGRGVYLMKVLMDEVSFRKTENGMEVTLVKKIFE
ncbi:MAG: ATP-binding protein, partial [candidate division KSB1 bacterium]|nr:ATP-binding protein [candidate division KSB1 bacterium]